MKNPHNYKKTVIYHYASLILILLLGLIMFYLNIGFPNRQLLVIILISFFYVMWGIIHHFLQGDLHPKIVVEYILIAIIAIMLLRGAIIR